MSKCGAWGRRPLSRWERARVRDGWIAKDTKGRERTRKIGAVHRRAGLNPRADGAKPPSGLGQREVGRPLPLGEG